MFWLVLLGLMVGLVLIHIGVVWLAIACILIGVWLSFAEMKRLGVPLIIYNVIVLTDLSHFAGGGGMFWYLVLGGGLMFLCFLLLDL